MLSFFSVEDNIIFTKLRKLRNQLEATSNFEFLQNEKIIPFFLDLTKGTKAEASLSDLLDDDGNPFRSDAELKEYIRNFYQKIYRATESDAHNREESTGVFLLYLHYTNSLYTAQFFFLCAWAGVGGGGRGGEGGCISSEKRGGGSKKLITGVALATFTCTMNTFT